MIKENLRAIKEDMKCIRESKRDFKQEVRRQIKQLENERVEAINDLEPEPDPWMADYWKNQVNQRYKKMQQDMLEQLVAQWHNDQVYYLIYKDGSECCITAEDILCGVKFPKITDVVYAEMQSADDHFDTETGDLDWYSEERMEACGYDYGVEDDRKLQYEAAIQYKFNTEWSRTFRKNNPEFVPIKINAAKP